MCGKNLLKKRYLSVAVLSAWMFFLFPTVLFSQSKDGKIIRPSGDDVQKIIEQISDYYLSAGANEGSLNGDSQERAGGFSPGYSDSNMEEIAEYFERLLRSPLNINSASRSDLQRLILLTDFQITALLEYIKVHGAVVSYTELSLLNGFNVEIVNFLRPFIYLGETSLRPGNFFKDCSSTFYSRYARKFSFPAKDRISGASADAAVVSGGGKTFGDNNYIQLRFRTIWLNKVEAAFLIEKDASEPMVEKNGIPCGDFISFGVALRNVELAGRRRGKSFGNSSAVRRFVMDNFIIGDFSARFGQGLTLWNSFNLQGAEDMYGFYKRGEPVSLYTSSDENNFFRGVAAEFSAGRVTVSLIGSYNGVDARLGKNGKGYTSILTGGIHGSESLLQTKDAMYEVVAGANLTALYKKIKLGFSFVGYGYSKENMRSVKDYNRFQIYDGFHINCAADFYTLIGRLRLFGECAYSSPGREREFGYAALAGGSAPLGKNWKINFIIRSYSRSYIATHAGAYTLTSSCSNQHGAGVRLSGNIVKQVRLSAGVDYAYYPWARFNIKSSSELLKAYSKMEYSAGKIILSARFFFRCLDTVKKAYLFSEKTAVKIIFSRWLNSSLSQEWNSANSYSFSALSNIKLSPFKINICALYYNASSWNGRLYVVERDLPMTYASTLLYGRGFGFYATAGASVFKWLELYGKIQRQFNSGKGEKKSPLIIKAGIRFNF